SLLSVLIPLILIVLFPVKTYAVGDFHLYSMPGSWAQDLPTGWVAQLHLRYVNFDKVFDENGDSRDAGMEVNAFQTFAKVIYVHRLSDEWQSTNVLITILGANLDAELDNGAHMSNSGTGDVMYTTFIGRWWKNHMIHTCLGVGAKLPLGEYDAKEPLNIGENRYVLYLPGFFFQFRFPLGKGLLLMDNAIGLNWRLENTETDYDDHDVFVFNTILTYFTSKDCKFGFFVQPDLQVAINESEYKGVHMNDGDYYTFATGLGAIWNIKPGCNVNLKWTREWSARDLDNGAYVPIIDAVHFMGTYSF
ncbi:MAG: transporter, partial [Syntrophobacteraceae bacterium]